ncbi:MAG: hypothetical protein IPF99_20745 [Deltaproteobacteria bacterium]|nr:hypothetical protein [Deltaproteobacteria bacterium]
MGASGGSEPRVEERAGEVSAWIWNSVTWTSFWELDHLVSQRLRVVSRQGVPAVPARDRLAGTTVSTFSGDSSSRR